MVSLLIEDVTLLKKEEIVVQVRFRGGATTMLNLPLPLNAWQGRKTTDYVLAQIDELLNHHTDGQVAALLNEQGLKTGADQAFTPASIHWIRYRAGLKSYKQRLRQAGMVTTQQIAKQLGVSDPTVKAWRRKGLLQGYECDDHGQWLYRPPSEHLILQKTRKKALAQRPTDITSSEATA
jgi:DNA-binding transcriptional regulator YiaG